MLMKASFNSAGEKLRYRPTENGYMGISLHSANHTGQSLECIVKWINEDSGFKFMRIGLSDTLNAHNYKLAGLTPLQAHDKAIAAGDEWLEKNIETLKKINIPTDLYRWDSWKKNSPVEYYLKHSELQHRLKTDPAFRAVVDKDITSFYWRKNEQTPTEVQRAVGRDYLIEELAVYHFIYRFYPNTTIYPGKQLACFAAIRDGSLANVSNTIADTNFLRLKLPFHQPEMERERSREIKPLPERTRTFGYDRSR